MLANINFAYQKYQILLLCLIALNTINIYNFSSYNPIIEITQCLIILAFILKNQIILPKSIILAIYIVLTISIISSIANHQNAFMLFIGSESRHLGLINFATVIFFILVGRNLNTIDYGKILLKLYIIIVTCNGIISILQEVKLFPNCVKINRGTCGITYNPNFSSTLSCIGLVIFVGLFLNKKSKWYFSASCLQALSLAFANSIQGIAMIFVICIVVLIKYKKLYILAIFPIFLILSYFLMSDLQNYKGNWLTLNKRVIASRIGYQIGMDNFFIGVGLDNLQSKFGEYIRVNDLKFMRPTEIYSHTHNIFTQYFATLGIFAVLSLIFIYSLALCIIFNLIFSEKVSYIEIIISCTSIVFLLSQLISIPEVYSQFIGFTAIGFIITRSTKTKHRTK